MICMELLTGGPELEVGIKSDGSRFRLLGALVGISALDNTSQTSELRFRLQFGNSLLNFPDLN